MALKIRSSTSWSGSCGILLILAAGLSCASAPIAVAQAVNVEQLERSISEALDGRPGTLTDAGKPAIRRSKSFTAKEKVEAVPVELKRPEVDLEVYFDPAASSVTKTAIPILDALGRVLSSEKFKGSKFRIAGHTDSIGNANYNLRLSRFRAETVRRYLIGKFKVEKERLEAVGYGKSQPKVLNDPASSLNRRVQVVNLSAVK